MLLKSEAFAGTVLAANMHSIGSFAILSKTTSKFIHFHDYHLTMTTFSHRVAFMASAGTRLE